MPKVREETEEIEVCPECGSHHLVRDYERGELLCEDCGLVLDDQFIDQGPEWRAFDVEQGEKRARTGAPMTYTIHDKGLSTEISWKNKDSYGKSIPDLLEEQGQLRQEHPHQEQGPAVQAEEVAEEDPCLQCHREEPRVRPVRAG